MIMTALEAKNYTHQANLEIVHTICEKVQQASKKGKHQIYFTPPAKANKDDLASLMCSLGYVSRPTAKYIYVGW